MATNTEDAMDEGTDSRNATFERKRPFDLATHDGSSNIGSTNSISNKRARRAGNLDHQDVRDFVPVGANFSKTAGSLGEVDDYQSEDGDDEEYDDTNLEEDSESSDQDEEGSAQQDDAALTEGRRLQVGNLSEAVTEDNIKALFHGYSIENIHIPQANPHFGPRNRQARPSAESKGNNIAEDGDTLYRATSEMPTASINEGRRLDNVAIPVHPRTQRSAGYAFVDFPSSLPARRARLELSGKLLFGRKLSFQEAKAPAHMPADASSLVKGRQAQIQEDSAINDDAAEDDAAEADAAVKFQSPMDSEADSGGNGSHEKVQRTRETPHMTAAQNSWNAGSSVAIRTRLGGNESWPERKNVEVLPEYDAMDRNQQKALYKAQEKLKELPNQFPRGPKAPNALEALYEAEIEFNYCFYYPAHEQWRNPPKVGQQGESIRSGTRTFEWRIKLRDLVGECMRDGTLQDLKDGKVRVDEQSVDTAFSAQHLIIDTSKAMKQTNISINQTAAVVHPDRIRDIETKPIKHINLPNRSYEQSDVVGGVILNVEPSRYINGGPPLSSQEKVDLLEEVNELWNEEQSDANSEGKSKGNKHDMENDSRSENGDAMMNSSNSEQAATEQPDDRQGNDRANTDSNARILRDLNPQELNAQLKYFYLTKTPADLSQDTPVKCLVCAGEGHTAGVCDSLTCITCGAYNQHMTRLCPQTTKCSKCRELGHCSSSCPYKLKNIAPNEILCDLCQRNGHTEEDCELMWRTAGKPWESNPVGNRVRLSCYECGSSGHLGNDCPTRRPGKSLGTSTWGSGNKQASIKSKGQISIRGRATQQEPIILDDSEDEMANFHRPKMPLPARKGQIKVNTASAQNAPNNRSQNEYNDSYGHNSRHRDYQDDEYKYTPRHGSTVRRRSVSPQYRDYGRDYRSDRYPPPHPQPSYQHQRASANADIYRPMPSSAQNAWSRHRV